MVPEIALVLHIATGALALTLGPLGLYAARRRGRGSYLAGPYHWAVLGVCASALLLAALDWSRLWWFVPIAAGSYGLALVGYLASSRRGPRWLSLRFHGLGGSYIALVTALMVVSVGSPLAWMAPTLVGSPLITRAVRRARERAASTDAVIGGRQAALEAGSPPKQPIRISPPPSGEAAAAASSKAPTGQPHLVRCGSSPSRG